MVSGKWARYRVEAVPLEKFAAKGTADLAVFALPCQDSRRGRFAPNRSFRPAEVILS